MSQSAEYVPFKNMTAGQKVVFIGKLIVFLCTFGFAYPTLLNDPGYAGGVVDRKHPQPPSAG